MFNSKLDKAKRRMNELQRKLAKKMVRLKHREKRTGKTEQKTRAT